VAGAHPSLPQNFCISAGLHRLLRLNEGNTPLIYQFRRPSHIRQITGYRVERAGSTPGRCQGGVVADIDVVSYPVGNAGIRGCCRWCSDSRRNSKHGCRVSRKGVLSSTRKSRRHLHLDGIAALSAIGVADQGPAAANQPKTIALLFLMWQCWIVTFEC